MLSERTKQTMRKLYWHGQVSVWTLHIFYACDLEVARAIVEDAETRRYMRGG